MTGSLILATLLRLLPALEVAVAGDTVEIKNGGTLWPLHRCSFVALLLLVQLISAFRFSAVAIASITAHHCPFKAEAKEQKNQRTLSVVGICWYFTLENLHCMQVYVVLCSLFLSLDSRCSFVFRYLNGEAQDEPFTNEAFVCLPLLSQRLLPLRHCAISWKPCAVVLRAVLL